jgi:hypothetical protein
MTNTQLELNQKVIEKVIKKYSGVSPYGYKNYQKKWTKFIDNSHIDNTLIVERDAYEYYKYHATMIGKQQMGLTAYEVEDDDTVCDFWSGIQESKVNLWKEFPKLEAHDLRMLMCFQELAMTRAGHFEGIAWKIRERICLDKYEGYTKHPIYNKGNKLKYKNL